MDVTEGVLGNKRCTLAVRSLDPLKRKLHESRDMVMLRRDDLQLGHGLAVGQGRQEVSKQRVEAYKLHVLGMTGGRSILLPSTRAMFAAKGCFSTNQDILFEMVSATRTDKIGKELMAVVDDFAE